MVFPDRDRSEMESIFETEPTPATQDGNLPGTPSASMASELRACCHCGTACRSGGISDGNRVFCCQGCRAVFEILRAAGLEGFYQLNENAGVRVRGGGGVEAYRFLD